VQRKSFKFKLYQSKKNRKLHCIIDLSAEIYNHCIALHKRYYKLFGKTLNKYQLQKHLAKLKRLPKYEHWKLVPSQSLQNIPERIDFGYQKFFRKENERPPSFRKRSKYKSFTLKQAGYRLLEANQIRIGKQVFKFFKSREIEGTIKTLTLKRDPLGDLYLFFSCELDEPPKTERQGQTSIGFDFGLKTFLTPSVEDQIESPLFFKQALRSIKQANKTLSRKQRGSKNRSKARKNLARVHKRIANQRQDYHFKLAKDLAEKYDSLFFEDLNIKAMQKLWGKKISDLAFSDYIRLQKWQCQKYGSHIEFIDRFFPSSKRCHVCLYINHELRLKDRQWVCPGCQTRHDRDKNASINIHVEGATSAGLGNVRLALRAVAA